MLHYYQPHLHHFLGRKQHHLVSNVNRAYYWSFEDALWDIFPSLGIQQGSTILLPDFYCMDVVNNIQSHGYKVEFYALDKNFQVNEDVLQQKVKHTAPSVIIIFHACGITSSIMKKQYIQTVFQKEIYIIEDAVHQLIKPEHVQILHTNHFIIDSLRKVSPLPGSFVYAKPEHIALLQQKTVHISWYSVQSGLYFLCFSLGLKIASLLNNAWLAHVLHDHVLKAHDDIVGDEKRSHAGIYLIQLLHHYIQFQRIEKIKRDQVGLYKTMFTQFKLPQVEIAITNESKLHVFPFVTSSSEMKKLVAKLHNKKLFLTHKFPDAPWSKKYGVLFLPLGPHIKKGEIEHLCTILAKNSLLSSV